MARHRGWIVDFGALWIDLAVTRLSQDSGEVVALIAAAVGRVRPTERVDGDRVARVVEQRLSNFATAYLGVWRLFGIDVDYLPNDPHRTPQIGQSELGVLARIEVRPRSLLGLDGHSAPQPGGLYRSHL